MSHLKPLGVIHDLHFVFFVPKDDTVFAVSGVQYIDLVFALLCVDRTCGTVSEVDKLYGNLYVAGR